MTNKKTGQTIRPTTVVTEFEDRKKFVLFKSDYFELKWNATGLESFAKKLQKEVDARKDWAGELYSQIARKMKYIHTKDVPLDVTKIDYEETIISFAEDVKKKISLRTVPVQKTIAETTKPKKIWAPKKFALEDKKI